MNVICQILRVGVRRDDGVWNRPVMTFSGSALTASTN